MTKENKCAFCGGGFTPRKGKKLCSPACRVKLYNKKQFILNKPTNVIYSCESNKNNLTYFTYEPLVTTEPRGKTIRELLSIKNIKK